MKRHTLDEDGLEAEEGSTVRTSNLATLFAIVLLFTSCVGLLSPVGGTYNTNRFDYSNKLGSYIWLGFFSFSKSGCILGIFLRPSRNPKNYILFKSVNMPERGNRIDLFVLIHKVLLYFYLILRDVTFHYIYRDEEMIDIRIHNCV